MDDTEANGNITEVYTKQQHPYYGNYNSNDSKKRPSKKSIAKKGSTTTNELLPPIKGGM